MSFFHPTPGDRFPRATRDDPTRSADVFSGPYMKSGRTFWHSFLDTLKWTFFILLFFGLMAIPTLMELFK